MILSILLLPLARLRDVGNLLRGVGFYFAGILLHLGKLGAVGDVVFRRPVPYFLLDRLLAVAGIRMVAEQLRSTFAVFLFQLLKKVGHRLRVISRAIHNDGAG